MPNDDRRSIARGSSRRLLLVGALVALALVAGVLFVITRDGHSAGNPVGSTPQPAATTGTTIAANDSEDDVVNRLREILKIREQAIRDRDATLFRDIYTSDCPCLRAGQAAIAALNKENIRWTNRSISLEVQSAKSVSNRLWEVVAVFVSGPFRIETEEGQLVRESPAERIRYRFLLVRTSDLGEWRLGSASPIEG
jgi:hypothetical protein